MKNKLKIHPKLKKYFYFATKECEGTKRSCCMFVGCGEVCLSPCKCCLCWEGYGGKKTINQVIKLYEK